MGTENKHIIRILKTHDQLVDGIKKVASSLNTKFKDAEQDVVLITIMKGGLPYSLELMKHLDFDITMDFVVSSSYYLDKQTDSLRTSYSATVPIKGKHVIVADDLVDSGRTIVKITEILNAYEPKSITVTGVYGKPSRIKTIHDEIYVWEEDPKGFLLGFGLDYDEKYRNLPYIAIIKED